MVRRPEGGHRHAGPVRGGEENNTATPQVERTRHRIMGRVIALWSPARMTSKGEQVERQQECASHRDKVPRLTCRTTP
jgi:hypothetical protein